MVSGYNPPAGQSAAILMTPVAAAQAAAGLRQALQQAGWQVIIAPDARSYVATAKACVVIVSPETTTDPEITAAISAGFTTLIPVMTSPTPVPYAQWSIAPVLLGSDATQQQVAAATILQMLGQPAPTTTGPQTAPTPMPTATPYYPQPAPMSTPYYPQQPAQPSMPMYPQGYPQQPAQPSMPMYPQGYPQQPYGQQAYPQYGAIPNVAGQKSGFPAWARNLIIVAVIAAILIGGYSWASSQHMFNPNALTGQWTMNLTINASNGQGGGGTQQAGLALTENGTQLTGTMNFGGSSIPMTGTYTGQNIALNGTLSDPTGQSNGSVDFVYNGTVTSDSQSMQGNAQYVIHSPGSSDVTYSGPWTASRSQGGGGSSASRSAFPEAALRDA